MSTIASDLENELVVSHDYGASRAKVWKANADGRSLAKWWGPKGFAVIVKAFDFRPGGTFHYCMRAKNGHEMWGKFVYREIREPERIVFVSSFADPDGDVVRTAFSDTFPLEIHNTVTLEEVDGKTRLTLRATPLGATAAELATFAAFIPSMQQGFGNAFEQLDEYLKENS